MRSKTPRTFGYWIKEFERTAWGNKAHADFYADERLLYNPYCGFCGWRVVDMDGYPVLEVTKGCGDIKYWRNEIYKILKALGLSLMLFHTYKRPQVFVRVLKLSGRVIRLSKSRGINGKTKHWILYSETEIIPTKSELSSMWEKIKNLPKPFGAFWKEYKDAMKTAQVFDAREQIFFNEKGFVCWLINAEQKALFVTRCCGNGRYWRRVVFKMLDTARSAGAADCIVTCSLREPKAYTRLFKCEVYKTEETKDGIMYWYKSRGDMNGTEQYNN